MRKKELMKKVIVSLIVCLLMLVNILPTVGNIVLADDEDSVEVNGYFTIEDQEPSTSCVANVSEQNMKLNFEVKLKNKGYLKSGNIKLDPNSNFEIGKSENVEIKNNQIKLRQMIEEESQTISLPIKFKAQEDMPQDYAKRNNQMTFSGVFVDNDAIEHVIEKSIDLELTWTEDCQSKIDLEIVKNLDYRIDENTNGKIVQEKIKISGNEKNIPVKSSNIIVDIPQIEGMELKDVKVDTDQLGYTQGREDHDVEFTEENYRTEENKLIINAENKAIEGVLKKSKGEDVYMITYQYAGKKTDNNKVQGNIELAINTYGEKEEKQTIQVEYDFSEAVGNLVQYTVEDKQSKVSKGYLMANNDENNYEINYSKRDVINISRADQVESIELTDKREYFVEKGDVHKYETEDEDGIKTTYKTTEFVKENLIKILGEDGKVEILNMKDEVIATITFDLEANEDGVYVVEYTEPISKIKIRTSKPVADGNISIVNTKAIIKLGYSINIIKDFYKLVTETEGTAYYVGDVKDNLGTQKSEVSIEATSSNATIEANLPQLSTTTKNEAINFKINLNNNEDTSDIYKNPTFEVRFPEEIKEVKVKSIDLFYANDELKILNVETLADTNQQVIRITLDGMQKSYNLNKETNGTVISFDVDLEVDQLTGNGTKNVEMVYYNEASIKYENEIQWNMLKDSKNVAYLYNGFASTPINFVAPQGLVSVQQTETKEEGKEEEKQEEKVTSVQQGEQAEQIEEGAEAKLATMGITLMNNTDKELKEVQILGRIPFKGNKDILTGKDLGTTVDTILDDEIKSINKDLKYKVFYSENGEATADLANEQNEWKEATTYKVGLAKSYLIVLDESTIIKPNERIEFTYDYVIPAGLKKGDAFFGTYVTYYKEETGEQHNSSADKVGYETEKEAKIEASINLLSDGLKELSDAEYEIVLTNTTDVDAKNLDITFEIPDEFSGENVDGENVSGYRTNNMMTINVPEVKANSDETVVTRFNVTALPFENQDNKVQISADIKGENLEKDVKVKTEEQQIEETKVDIVDDYYEYLIVAGKDYEQFFRITNVSEEEYKNVKITKKFGNAFEYAGCELKSKLAEPQEVSDIYEQAKNSELTDEQRNEIQRLRQEAYNKQLNVAENYDENSKTVTWTIESLKPGEYLEINYKVFIKIMDNADKVNKDTISTTCELGDGQNIINTQNELEYNQSKIDIKQLNSIKNGYGKEQEEVTYVWEINNNNNYSVTDFEIKPEVSENAKITEISLETPLSKKNYNADSLAPIYAILPNNSSSKLIVKAQVLEGATDFVSSEIVATYDDVYKKHEQVFTKLENQSESSKEITGTAFVDKDVDQTFGENDQILPGIVVELYDAKTNKLIASQITDLSGRYTFKNLLEGNYYVKFNYDESKYKISSEVSDKLLKDKSNIINVNDNYVTDNIILSDKSVSNINLPLMRDNIFDFKLDASVNKMIVQNSYESTEFIPENTKLAKVDIDPKLLSDSKVIIEYNIKVTNQGSVNGTVDKIVDYKLKDIVFDSELNPDWYLDANDNLYNTSLKDVVIKPGESKTISLKLIKNVNEQNTGLIHNTFEIAQSSNSNSLADIDSTSYNKLNEDDLSTADAIVGIVTGFSFNKTVLILPILMISIILGIVIWRIIEKRKYV